MLEILNNIFILPLISVMNLVLAEVSRIYDYGPAILYLALTVNLALLPVYHIADQWQISERNLQNKMRIMLDDIKKAFKGQERFMMIKTLYRQHGYHPLMSLRSGAGFLIQIPFFIAAYQLLSHSAIMGESFLIFKDLGKPDALLTIGGTSINLMPLVMTAINIISAYVYTQELALKDKIQLFGIAGIFLFFLYNAPVGLVIYWTCNNIFSLFKNMFYLYASKKNTLSSPQKTPPKARISWFNFAEKQRVTKVFYLFLTLIGTLLFLYLPVSIYSSDIEFFSIDKKSIFISALPWFFWMLFLLSVLYHYLTSSMRSILLLLLLTIIVYCVFNMTVNLIDVGFLNQYIFAKPEGFLTGQINLVYDLSIGIGALLIALIVLKTISLKNIQSFFLIVLISIMGITVTKVITIKKSAEVTEYSYFRNMLSFSKTEKNVLILMLDAFTGQHVEKILTEYPKVKEEMTGFTWYPDTISTGTFTYMGAMAIHGGFNYSPDAINLRSSEITSIEDEYINAYGAFTEGFMEHGYDIVLAGTQFTNCSLLQKRFPDITLCNTLKGYEHDFFTVQNQNKMTHKDQTIEQNQNNFLLAYALYTVAPYSFKQSIYHDGNWLDTVSENNLLLEVAPKYSTLPAFPHYSNTLSEKPTLKYIQTSYTHRPWLLSSDCQTVNTSESNRRAVDLYDESGVKKGHYAAEVCALKEVSNWIKWMKKEQIYDNTMIILVSDHGHFDNPELSAVFGHSSKNITHGFPGYPGNPSSLLMVKDFNSTGTPEKSNKFMSNADTGSIACTAISGCKNFPEDARKIDDPRSIIFSIGHFQPELHSKNKFDIPKQYRIKNSMYKKENWEQIK